MIMPRVHFSLYILISEVEIQVHYNITCEQYLGKKRIAIQKKLYYIKRVYVLLIVQSYIILYSNVDIVVTSRVNYQHTLVVVP